MDDAPEEEQPELVLTMDASPALTVPGLARSFVRTCVGMLDARPTETILLLTSEMVTNSVQHARTERVTVSLCRVGASLRVAIADEDPEPPVLRSIDPSRLGGLGVQMVDRMSTAWGVEAHGSGGKQVWFEVDAT